MTISVTKGKNHYELNLYEGSSQSGGRLRCQDFENSKLEDFVIEPLLGGGEKNCSFSRDEIIPILRIYDPASAKEKLIAGKKRMTYLGALMVFCPTTQKAKFASLRKGELIDQAHESEGSSP